VSAHRAVAPLSWPSAPVRTAGAVAGSCVLGCRLSRRRRQSAGRAGQRSLVGPAGHAGSAAHCLLILVAAAPGIQRGWGSPLLLCRETEVAPLSTPRYFSLFFPATNKSISLHKLRKKKKKSIVLLRKEIMNKPVVDLLQQKGLGC